SETRFFTEIRRASLEIATRVIDRSWQPWRCYFAPHRVEHASLPRPPAHRQRLQRFPRARGVQSRLRLRYGKSSQTDVASEVLPGQSGPSSSTSGCALREGSIRENEGHILSVCCDARPLHSPLVTPERHGVHPSRIESYAVLRDVQQQARDLVEAL